MSRRHRIDDAAAEELLAGRVPPGRDDLAGLATAFRDIRESAGRQTAPVMAAALREASATPVLDITDRAPVSPEAWATPRRQRMNPVTALGAVLGTITGKVVIGAAVAAASVGGLHAADVVDVPGLPDEANPAAEANHPGTEIDLPTDGAGTAGQPEGAGVEGSEVSDRATSGEPQADGQQFGTTVATDATEGTPAEGTVGTTGGEAGASDAPAGPSTGDEYSDGAPYDEGSAPAGPETGGDHAGTAGTNNPTDRP